MDRERIVQIFFFGLLALIAYQLYLVLYPFLTAIAWAILLAFLAHPALTHLNRVIKSRTTCAVLVTIVVALGVILPSVWVSGRIVHEAQTLYTEMSALTSRGGVSRTSDWIRDTNLGGRLDAALERRGITLEHEMRTIGVSAAKIVSDYTLQHAGSVASNLATFLLHFAIAMLTFFYLLRDGESYYEGLRDLTPLHEEDKAALFERLRLTLSAVMRGMMLTAALDGLALGLGYLALGVPYWLLLGILTAAAGLLPIGGTTVVWVPITIYLGVESGWIYAVVMAAWAMITLAIVDNFIKPLAMRHGTGLPTVALFFGLAGGIAAYGPLGIFAGPAVIAVFAVLLQVYRREYGPDDAAGKIVVTDSPHASQEPLPPEAPATTPHHQAPRRRLRRGRT
jgi:predicted PurR-regulated permease PerM